MRGGPDYGWPAWTAIYEHSKRHGFHLPLKHSIRDIARASMVRGPGLKPNWLLCVNDQDQPREFDHKYCVVYGKHYTLQNVLPGNPFNPELKFVLNEVSTPYPYGGFRTGRFVPFWTSPN